MYKCLVSLSLALLVMCCLVSCSSTNSKPLSIGFSADSTSIVFSGIDPAGLLVIRNTPGIDTAYAELITVLQLPVANDSTSIELPLPGQLVLKDKTVVFKPLNSFIPGRSYLVMCYMNVKFGDSRMLLSGKLNHRVKPQQVTLKR